MNSFHAKKVCGCITSLLFFITYINCFAQGPAPDPSFMPSTILTQADVRQAIEQPDGKRLVIGYFSKVQGQPARYVARYLPGGNQLDASFEANTAGLQGYVDEILLMPNGQILLADIYGDSLKLGTVRRRAFLRLNADGTPDASFDASQAVPQGTSVQIGSLLAQPDGKVVITGNFNSFNGLPAGSLVRLNANGSVDAAFQAAGSGLNDAGTALELQSDGKILVGGNFTTVHGQASPGLARLLPSGQRDVTFNPQASAATYVVGFALDANSNILVALQAGAIGGNISHIQRLRPSGTQDLGFTLAPLLQVAFYPNPNTPAYNPIRVLTDGKILVNTTSIYNNGDRLSHLIRLNSQGGLDNSFISPPLIAEASLYIHTVQPLANGKILVAGSPNRFGGPTAPLSPVAVLQATGLRDLTFAPNLQWNGTINAIVQQADGKLVVGGTFNEINRTATQNIARLNTDGTVDNTFSPIGADGEVFGLSIQPDGKILLTGNFISAGGVARPAVARLLPAGTVDAAFVPAVQSTTFSSNELASGSKIIATNGQVLVSGLVYGGSGLQTGLLRLDGLNGQLDANFQSAATISGGYVDLLIQPDGKLLVGGYMRINGSIYGVCRLLPNGGLDPTFNLTSRTGNNNVASLALDATGRIYVGGNLTNFGSFSVSGVARLLSDGSFDTSFTSALSSNQYQSVRVLTVQPNGRLLVGGYLNAGNGAQGTVRLLDSGGLDASYSPGNGPSWNVFALLVQANGAIVAGGDFVRASGLSYTALYRMLDSNVLGAVVAKASNRLEVWPIPAHGQIQVRLPERYYPTTVTLINALGQRVKTYSISSTNNILDIASVSSGIYFLHVEGHDGAITQKLSIE